MGENKCGGCVTRRKFLEVGGQTIAGASIAVLGGGMLGSCGSGSSGGGGGGNASSSGTKIANSSSGVYTFAFADYSALQSAGGSIQFSVSASSGTKNVYVTRVSSTVATTVSTTCTHQGCTLDSYSSSTQNFTCPCHGSVFSSSGAVTSGVATTALTSYLTSVTSSGIQVTIP